MSPKNLFARILILLLAVLGAGPALAERTTTYYHTDALGSVVAATSEAGALLWRKEYAPYGAQLPGSTGGAERLSYTGKAHDAQLGITNFGARQYDPEIGRFLSVDPVGFVESNPMSFNRYLYVNDNPYKYVDPDGEFLNFAAKFVLDVAVNIAFNYVTTGTLGVGAALKESAQGIANPAKTVVKAKRLAQAISKSKSAKSGQVFERVVNKAELKATQETGLLRGGRAGENFFTNTASLDAKRAQQRLGLDGELRDARIRFKIKNDIEVSGPRSAAPGRSGTAGGGREFSTNGKTEIEILRVDQLRK